MIEQLLDELDDELFAMLTRPVDANDIADILAKVRAIRAKLHEELQNASEPP